MKNQISAVVAIGVIGITLGINSAFATGNGAPSGTHYNLNILGKENCAGDDLTGSERHTIQVLLNFQDNPDGTLAVDLDKRNKIFLVASEDAVGDSDLHVLDGNACDGNGATFALPRNVSSAWTVWARAGGKPGGTATITTCATDPTTTEIVCSTENVVLLRTKGKQSFTNVTRELTTICWDTDGDGACDVRVPLFDPQLQDYFWNYSNSGLRLAQLRFYQL
jgi:hypothetical protein